MKKKRMNQWNNRKGNRSSNFDGSLESDTRNKSIDRNELEVLSGNLTFISVVNKRSGWWNLNRHDCVCRLRWGDAGDELLIDLVLNMIIWCLPCSRRNICRKRRPVRLVASLRVSFSLRCANFSLDTAADRYIPGEITSTNLIITCAYFVCVCMFVCVCVCVCVCRIEKERKGEREKESWCDLHATRRSGPEWFDSLIEV